MSKYEAYGTNIEIVPISKNKIVGDTSKYYLLGTVVSKGKLVNPQIEIGDTLAYTLWGVNKVENADGSEKFYIQDNSDFILAIMKNES